MAQAAAIGRARGSPARGVILEAALRTVASQGLAGASLGAVALEAGTSKTAVLYHFGSAERLRRELAATALDRIHQLVYEAYVSASEAEKEPARVALEGVFRDERRPLLLSARELMNEGVRDPVVAASTRASFDQIARLIALWLGGPPAETLELARTLVASMWGHVEVWLSAGEVDPIPYLDGALHTLHALLSTRP